MERFIPLVDDADLRSKLGQAIDGKGAFRRFKDVLMNYATEREKWFGFRSERLRTFMEAWLNAHAIQPVARPPWAEGASSPETEAAPESVEDAAPKSQSGRRTRNAETLRQNLKEVGEALGPRDLEMVVGFAEFLKARRAARGFAHHHEHLLQDRTTPPASSAAASKDEGGVSSS
jgi:hypothetical protein